jgi:hypothetical protein
LQGAQVNKTRKAASVVVIAVFLATGASSAFGDELFVYLVEDNLPRERVTWWTDLNQLNLVEPPLITIGDIVSYDWSMHKMVVTPECGTRLSEKFAQRTRHAMISRPFVVAVDSSRIYMGVLNGVLSSWFPTEVPVISIPIDDGIVSTLEIWKVAKGYDERNDTRIRAVLEQAGVLIDR